LLEVWCGLFLLLLVLVIQSNMKAMMQVVEYFLA